MRYVTAFRAMGCQSNVWLDTPSDNMGILQQVPVWVEELEAVLSRFRPESELSQLNAHVGEWQPVSEVLMANIVAAKQGARITDGLYNPLLLDALVAAGYDRSFDQLDTEGTLGVPVPAADWHAIDIDTHGQRVRLPARIDLGGIAKGWTAAAVADRLFEYGPCLVDLGGDIAARGIPEGLSGWDVAVADPTQPDESLLTLQLTGGAVVTSGTDYRHWQKNGQTLHHLIDPRTGRPAQTDVLTVTVVHPHAPTAEVYAKAVLMMGSRAGLEWINQQPHRDALVVRIDGAVLATDHFSSLIIDGSSLPS